MLGIGRRGHIRVKGLVGRGQRRILPDGLVVILHRLNVAAGIAAGGGAAAVGVQVFLTLQKVGQLAQGEHLEVIAADIALRAGLTDVIPCTLVVLHRAQHQREGIVVQQANALGRTAGLAAHIDAAAAAAHMAVAGRAVLGHGLGRGGRDGRKRRGVEQRRFVGAAFILVEHAQLILPDIAPHAVILHHMPRRIAVINLAAHADHRAEGQKLQNFAVRIREGAHGHAVADGDGVAVLLLGHGRGGCPLGRLNPIQIRARRLVGNAHERLVHHKAQIVVFHHLHGRPCHAVHIGLPRDIHQRIRGDHRQNGFIRLAGAGAQGGLPPGQGIALIGRGRSRGNRRGLLRGRSGGHGGGRLGGRRRRLRRLGGHGRSKAALLLLALLRAHQIHILRGEVAVRAVMTHGIPALAVDRLHGINPHAAVPGQLPNLVCIGDFRRFAEIYAALVGIRPAVDHSAVGNLRGFRRGHGGRRGRVVEQRRHLGVAQNAHDGLLQEALRAVGQRHVIPDLVLFIARSAQNMRQIPPVHAADDVILRR